MILRRRTYDAIMPKKPPQRAYGYVRVSTDEQVDEGISLRAQRYRIKAYAQAHGLTLVRTYADEGITGRTMDRPGLQKLIRLAKSSECETIIVYRLSRLSRRTRDLLFLIEDVFLNGCTRLISINEHIDTETAMGRFLLTIMGAMAQMERELIAERTKASLRFKQEQGQQLGSAPYGFRWNTKGKLVQVAKEMRVVRRIFKLRKQGMSYGKIAKALNESKVKTKRGGTWHPATVRYIEMNKRYKRMLSLS